MKHFFLALLAMLCVTPVWAQLDEDVNPQFGGQISFEKSNAFFVGIKGGANYSTITQPNEGKLFDGGDIGFSGGLAMKARFGKATENSAGGTGFIGLGLEAKYKMVSAKTFGKDENGSANAKLTLSYIDVPVTVQIYPMPKLASMNTFYVEVGCAFDVFMSCKPKSLTLENPSADFSQVTYDLDTDGSKLKGGAISPIVGIGYTVPGTGLDLNARYYVGMSKLAGNFPCKVSTAEVSIAWLFNAGKF